MFIGLTILHSINNKADIATTYSYSGIKFVYYYL